MCCGQESKEGGSRCQSFTICCSNPDSGLLSLILFSLFIISDYVVRRRSEIFSQCSRFPPPFFFGRVAGFALYLAWMRRVYHLSLPLSKLCVRELQLSPQFNVITEMCAS